MPSLAGSRLLMTADAVGGVWTYALDLARGLAPLGMHTTLVVLGPEPSSDQIDEAAAVPGLTLATTGLPLDWMAESAGEVRRTAEAVAAMVGEHALVHLNSPALAGLAAFERPVIGVAHSCVRTWWAAVHDGSALPRDLAWRAELLANGYRRCDRLLAPTRSFAAATTAAYDLAERPTVVANGRSQTRQAEEAKSDVSKHAERSSALRDEPLRSSPRHGEVGGRGKVYAFTAGRLWDEGKGVALLDTAAAAIRIPVRAAGPTAGPNGARIELATIEMLGRLNETELAAAFAERPIFVSPALYEPFGLAVLEAAASRCALVLSDIPTFRELWEDAAVFVPPRSATALASAVNALADDSGRRAEWGHAAAERSRRYRLGPFVDGMAAVYRDVLGAPATAARNRPAAAALEAVP